MINTTPSAAYLTPLLARLSPAIRRPRRSYYSVVPVYETLFSRRGIVGHDPFDVDRGDSHEGELKEEGKRRRVAEVEFGNELLVDGVGHAVVLRAWPAAGHDDDLVED